MGSMKRKTSTAMFYTIITILLIFISFIIFLPKFKSATEQYSLGINFILTLIATLVGVLLAISITNYESDRKEKQDVIKLLNSAITAVETCQGYSEELIEYFINLPDSDNLKQEFYVKNPLPYPTYLDTLLMQSIVSKNLSGAALTELNQLLINLKRSRQNNSSLYLIALSQAIKVLSLEIAFQNHEITEHQLNAQLDNIGTIADSIDTDKK